MDELSAFKGADTRLRSIEKSNSSNTPNLVFTGGQVCTRRSVTNIQRSMRFPAASIANTLCRRAARETIRKTRNAIPHPRLGFFGVIDERFDIEIARHRGRARPDWHFVMIGPVVKIDPESLPQRPNIHYLGAKNYEELAAYIAGWDVALLLFADNESTRFISPTKTPEYLAAGKPVFPRLSGRGAAVWRTWIWCGSRDSGRIY